MPEFQVSPPDPPLPGEEEDKTATAFSDLKETSQAMKNYLAEDVVSEQNPNFKFEDIPLDTREQITLAELPDRVCTQCLEDNLVRSGVIETFVKCQKCGEEFCLHGVSKLDPQYCIHCCNDFKVVDVIEQAQRPIYNKDGSLIAVRQFKVRHITLSGLHWLFFNRAISTLTDVELEHAIEYHMSIYHGMIYEREARRVQKSHRNKGKHATNEFNPFVSTENGVQFVTSSNTQSGTKTKKVRTRTVKVSQSSTSATGTGTKGSKGATSPEAIQALIQTLMQAGVSQEQILAMGKK